MSRTKIGLLLKPLYFIIIIAISFGGNYHIGDTTPRQIVAVLMFVLCLLNFNTIKSYYNRIVGLYAIYLFFVFISAYYDDSQSVFVRNLAAQHLVALTSYGAVAYYYTRFKSFDAIIVAFLFCGIINMAVCFLQYFGNPLGFQLGLLFIDENEISANRHMEKLMEGTGSYLLGMRGDAVHNGYFQMIMPFFLVYIHYKYILFAKASFIRDLIYYCFLTMLFVVVLLIQERSCILFCLGSYIFYLLFRFASLSVSKRILVGILTGFVLICGLYLLLPLISEYIGKSRFVDHDNSIREYLFSNTLNFISEHPFLGGMSSFVRMNGFPPHNIFLNAFVEAGICGFILSLCIYIKQMKTSFKLNNARRVSLIAFAFIAYMLNSLLHNDSILSGDVVAWILWAMVFSLSKNKIDEAFK